MTTHQKNTNTYHKYLNYFHYAFISILALVALYLVCDSWNWKYTMDSPPIRYVAKRILAGELAYKDIFEFNMPFTYLVHVIILPFSESDLAVRVADLIFQFIGMWGIFRLLHPINPKAALAAPLLFLCFNIMIGPTAMLQRDLMIVCLMPHIFYPFLYSDKIKNYHFIISTIVCLCAILIKPFVLVLLLLLIVVIIFDPKVRVQAKKDYIATIFITLFSGIFSVCLIFIYLDSATDFIEILKFLNYFSSGSFSFYDFYFSIKFIFQSRIIVLVLSIVLSISFFYSLKNRSINWYVVVTFIYSIFHFYIQKKGFIIHAITLNTIVICIVCFVFFNENKTNKEYYFYSANCLIFIVLFLKAVFRYSASLQPLYNEHKNTLEAVPMLKNYNFQTIQALDIGVSGIEIVERLNKKNKYPLYYNFLLNYDKSERINQYKKALLKDIKNGDIDILIFSSDTDIMYSKLSILDDIEKSIKLNYDSLDKIIYPGKTVIYKSKKLGSNTIYLQKKPI